VLGTRCRGFWRGRVRRARAQRARGEPRRAADRGSPNRHLNTHLTRCQNGGCGGPARSGASGAAGASVERSALTPMLRESRRQAVPMRRSSHLMPVPRSVLVAACRPQPGSVRASPKCSPSGRSATPKRVFAPASRVHHDASGRPGTRPSRTQPMARASGTASRISNGAAGMSRWPRPCVLGRSRSRG
jgi:hypothetical protein